MRDFGRRPVPALETTLSKRYQLKSVIGKGATAHVFRATDLLLEQDVAVKVLLIDPDSHPAASDFADFRREALAAMRLSHPNVLRTYNYERHEDWEYLVMEFVEAEACGRRLKRLGRLPEDEVVEIGLACLSGLAYAHDQGIIHHDLKPNNILQCKDGSVKLCDFGLARFAITAEPTKKSMMMGTPAFVSPERIRGGAGDSRSDLYSLAMTLFAMGNGEPAFGGEVPKVWQRHLTEKPPEVSALSGPIHEVIRKSLAKKPEDRYQSAVEMQVALSEAFQEATGRKSQTTPYNLAASRGVLSKMEAKDTPPPIPPEMVAVPRPESRPLVADFIPVTNAQYSRFVNATSHTPPAHWGGATPPAEIAGHPVVSVSLADAEAYAKWVGKRLPKAEEWLTLCGRSDGSTLPWGGEWDATRCNGPDDFGLGHTTDVLAHPGGVSRQGCFDLVGNVWEWAAPNEESTQTTVALGGSFQRPGWVNGRIAEQRLDKGAQHPDLGFRCVRDG